MVRGDNWDDTEKSQVRKDWKGICAADKVLVKVVTPSDSRDEEVKVRREFRMLESTDWPS